MKSVVAGIMIAPVDKPTILTMLFAQMGILIPAKLDDDIRDRPDIQVVAKIASRIPDAECAS